jgi:hypothetical protein
MLQEKKRQMPLIQLHRVCQEIKPSSRKPYNIHSPFTQAQIPNDVHRSRLATQSDSLEQLTSSTHAPCWQLWSGSHSESVVHVSTSEEGPQTASKQTQRPRAQRGLRDNRQSTLSEQESAAPLPGFEVEARQKPSVAHVSPGTVQSLSSEQGVPEVPASGSSVGVEEPPDVTVTKPLLGLATGWHSKSTQAMRPKALAPMAATQS